MNAMKRCRDCGKLALIGDTVTISAEEYETLKMAAAEQTIRLSGSAYRAASRSAIARTPELAAFILEQYKTHTVVEVAKNVAAKFGSSAPSRSSIHRFIKAFGQVR